MSAERRRLRELMDLSGRTALITGGAGHVGRAMAEALAELGAGLILLDTDRPSCEAVAADIASEWSTRCEPLIVDLTDDAAVHEVPSEVERRFGGLDVLLNNAALVGSSELEGWAVPFADQSPATWRCALDVNLTAPFVLTQACAPLLAAMGHGSVVNVGSIYGLVGPRQRLYEGTSLANPAAYAASKGGLQQLTRWLATTLAPAVRVNAMVPGGILRGQPEAFVGRYEEQTPLGRMATEQDLKGAVAYLASDLSAYVTGQMLVVDGGWTAW